MDHFVMNNSDASKPHEGCPPLGTSFATSDVTMALLPPGEVDVKLKAVKPMFDVNLNQCLHHIGINSDRRRQEMVAAESIGFFPRDTEVSIATSNVLPGCVVEISDEALMRWTGETDNDSWIFKDKMEYRVDRVGAYVGRAAIRFLRSEPTDSPQNRMTLEALALGISSRAFALFIAGDGDVSAEIDSWKSRGDLYRVRRAVDWAETYLIDPALSVSDMATAAGLSTCHFGVVFKSHMGESPYAYVLRRRAQFARDLIEGTEDSIAQVAYVSGFSSQAHLTTVMRRVLGVTPGKLRSQG